METKKNRLLPLWEIARIIADMPGPKPTVVFSMGVFNTPESEYMVYPHFLESLKDDNKLMIIGIFSNEFLVQRESLESNVASLEARIEFLSNMKSIDFIVVINSDDDAYSVVKDLRPTELVTTHEVTGYLRESHEALERALSGYTKVVSIESRREKKSEVPQEVVASS